MALAVPSRLASMSWRAENISNQSCRVDVPKTLTRTSNDTSTPSTIRYSFSISDAPPPASFDFAKALTRMKAGEAVSPAGLEG